MALAKGFAGKGNFAFLRMRGWGAADGERMSKVLLSMGEGSGKLIKDVRFKLRAV